MSRWPVRGKECVGAARGRVLQDASSGRGEAGDEVVVRAGPVRCSGDDAAQALAVRQGCHRARAGSHGPDGGLAGQDRQQITEPSATEGGPGRDSRRPGQPLRNGSFVQGAAGKSTVTAPSSPACVTRTPCHRLMNRTVPSPWNPR